MRWLIPIRTPRWISWFYPRYLWGVRHSKAIYLTFDDYPTPETTPKILDLLEAHKAKATFFCVGNNIEKHPEIFKQIIAQGHSWGNHTYHHNDFNKETDQEFRNSVEKCSKSIQKYAPQDTKLFRPPQGRINGKYTKLLGEDYQVVFWSVLSMDHRGDSSILDCIRNLKKAKGGDILVLHDNIRTKKTTLESLEAFLKWANKNNLTLLGLPMQ